MQLRTEDWDLILKDRPHIQSLSVDSSRRASDTDDYNTDDEERAQKVVGNQWRRDIDDSPFPMSRIDLIDGAILHDYSDYMIERREYKDSVAIVKGNGERLPAGVALYYQCLRITTSAPRCVIYAG